ncbi:TlpA family protein disulfide reductase [Croceicoccus gelatinilyticus]|uniref:TlpA family protein disulfide reductase n=1 Tax=Croceicoccus gelatinilyticus TaxID=2835536 RepID=UPI001CED048F|nr:TlpA disulfide reductase family protein [Croceicoccus gelatinilyticus]
MPVIEISPPFKFLAGIALACAVPAIAACDRQSEAPEQPEASVSDDTAATQSGDDEFNGTLDTSTSGQEMPDFAITLPDGTSKKLSDFKGKPLLVNLWATWCGPCVLEMPMLDELAGRYPDKLKVIVVSQDMGGAEVVEPWFAEKEFSHLEPWMDPKNDLGFSYNTGMLPTTVLYDADGKEVWRMIGGHDWSNAETEAMLADTIGG